MEPPDVTPRPPLRQVAWNDDVSLDHPAPLRHQTPEEMVGDAERWVRDHAEGPSGQLEICCIDLHHDDRLAGEALAKSGRSAGVQLDGDDAGSCVQERVGQDTGTCTDVEYEMAGLDRRVGDDQSSPALIEPVPPPQRPGTPGHGAS
jgi:hypothetical protein